MKYDYTRSPYNPTGQSQHSHTTHQKHRVMEINFELAAEAEMPNKPEEDLSVDFKASQTTTQRRTRSRTSQGVVYKYQIACLSLPHLCCSIWCHQWVP